MLVKKIIVNYLLRKKTGFISQNVYLYCASAGLNTAVIGSINRDKLHETMGLDYSVFG